MMKLILIFAVTINNIMQSKEIITAPIVDAITPSGVVDSPSTCGALIFTDMKLIKLSQGKFTQVDDWNYDWLMQWKWCAIKGNTTFYAVRNSGTKGKGNIKMHREIMQTPKDMDCDHRNHDGLDNQEHNLRNCTEAQNTWNQIPFGKSKYLGVGFSGKQIQARIWANGVLYYLGTFKTEEAAARAYDAKAKIVHGEFANLNFK